MAKKKETKPVVVEETVTQEEVVEVVRERLTPKTPEWEIKDRMYYLKGNKNPITYIIRSSNVYWFDEEKGYERELKYCKNQKTPFVDEMKGDQRLEHIIFRDGNLFVPKEQTTLQKLLSKYHPHKDKIYFEWKPEMIAGEEMAVLELEADAILAARDMDIDMAEAIMRAEIGSKVSELSSKELKRDLLVFARNNPRLLLDLADDENVMLRNFGIKSVEMGYLRISQDQRYFMWGTNGRKLMNVPFEEHPYSALANWFKTDEGMEVYSQLEKKMS